MYMCARMLCRYVHMYVYMCAYVHMCACMCMWIHMYAPPDICTGGAWTIEE